MTEKISLGLFFSPVTNLPIEPCHRARGIKAPLIMSIHRKEKHKQGEKLGIPVPFPARGLYDNVTGTSGVAKNFPCSTTLTFMTARELGTTIISFLISLMSQICFKSH